YQVEPNGLDIDRVVDLVPVDAQGERVQQVDVEPAAIHVRVAVFQDGQTRTVPVTPLVTGEPAPGFELASVEVDPLIVTVEGDGEQLTTVNRAETERIPLGGATGSFQRTVQLVLPTGILAVGSDEVRVTVTLRPVTASRTFDAGVFLDGARSDLEYALSTGSVLAIVGGSPGDLARLQGATFRVQANVAGLAPGVHEVSLAADLPAGLALLSTSPTAVTVTITDPRPPSPSPAASP
ncbi:MAG TPA: CdaR family protein, partial [Vitreimonas sp.]|nr:CdaR family protein [Vitreimonas sp.]